MIVLDASALLALIKHEPGWDVVATAAAVEEATVSPDNYSATLQKAARPGWAWSQNWSTRVSMPSASP